MDKMSTEL